MTEFGISLGTKLLLACFAAFLADLGVELRAVLLLDRFSPLLAQLGIALRAQLLFPCFPAALASFLDRHGPSVARLLTPTLLLWCTLWHATPPSIVSVRGRDEKLF